MSTVAFVTTVLSLGCCRCSAVNAGSAHASDLSSIALVAILFHNAASRIMPTGVRRVMRRQANRSGPSRPGDTVPFKGL